MIMKIRKASIEEYPEVKAFYYSLIDAIAGTEYRPKWQKDIYPASEDFINALEEESLYVGELSGRIAAAMVVNKNGSERYDSVSWLTDAAPSEYMVIHLLGVHNDFARRGLAKEMVRYALELATESGMKAVRLDVLTGNLPAERLYLGMGFEYIETVNLFYEDTGWMDFQLYEYDLTKHDAPAALD